MKKLGITLLFWLGLVTIATAQQPTPNCQPGVNLQTCVATSNAIGITNSTVENSHVMKASAGTISGMQVNNTNAASRWVMLFDAATLPSNGAVTGCTDATPHTAGCVLKWYQIGAASTVGISWAPGPPLKFHNGLVAACSSAGPFTLTAAADCTFSGEIN